MSERKNCHDGHRERLKHKLLFHRDSLTDHELMELLLFYSIPRKDTNEIAHNLCNVFGNINNVLLADRKALLTFEGIGDNSVTLFALISEVMYRARFQDDIRREYFSFIDFKGYLLEHYSDGLAEEEVLVLLFDREHKLLAAVPLDHGIETAVTFKMEDLLDLITSYKPKFLVLAHNHPNGSDQPSEADDICTAKVNLLCSIHAVKLLDHIIFCRGKFYSYHMNNRMKEKFTAEDYKQLFDLAKEMSDEKS